MEILNAASRQSVVGLPPINHVEADKIKREEVDYLNQRKHSLQAMVSPMNPFAGPGHAYSNHQSSPASSLPAGPLGGLLSPPESRRTSSNNDEKEQRPTARQSLPSIHEALGSEPPPLPYPAPPPSAPASASQQYFPSPSAVSPADQRARYSVDHINNQGPPNPFSQPPPPRSPFSTKSISIAPPPPPTHAQTDPLARPSFPSTQHNSKFTTLHPIRTTQSPTLSNTRPNPPYSSLPPQPASSYDAPASHSAGPMNPQYGFQQYPPNYGSMSAPASNTPSSSGYPPSEPVQHSAPPRYHAPAWRENPADFGRSQQEKKNDHLLPYGENVKRHLERFDLEASLNEMAEGASRIVDFSRMHRQRPHEHQRIGLNPQSLPRLADVDEMLQHGEKIQMSLQRMREVVFSHQQASLVEAPRESHYQPINNGYDHNGQNSFHDDTKGNPGFAVNDPNKRKRGRAAPPGRCHSCRRSETPEWRRGPDGARTLCNACGLHYAKLTRKSGGKPVMTSSNLRPKSMGEGSPA